MISIPALTVKQPYATLLALGIKRFETRLGWAPDYRGPVAIHAGRDTSELNKLFENIAIIRHWSSKEWTRYVKTDPYGLFIYTCSELLKPYGYRKAADFPLGAIIGVNELRHCYAYEDQVELVSDAEKSMGYWRQGYQVWHMPPMFTLPVPIPKSGQPNLWDWRFPEYVGHKLGVAS